MRSQGATPEAGSQNHEGFVILGADKRSTVVHEILDALSEPFAVLDAQGIIVLQNKAWRAAAAANFLDPEGLNDGANYFEVCLRSTKHDDVSRFADGLRSVINGRLKTYSFEYSWHAGNHLRWYRARVTPFQLDGQARALVGHTDITALKLTEQALDLRSNLLNTVEQAVIAIDLSGLITYCNRFAEQMYGWPADELLGRNVYDLIPTSGMDEQAADIMAQLSTGRSWSGEFTVRHRDGTTFPAYIRDTPIFDEQGTIVGIVGTSVSLTEHKRDKAKLHESEGRFRALVSQAMVGVAHSDLAGRFTLVNQKYCEITGYSEEELLGMRMQELTHPDDLPRNLERFEQLIARGTPFEFEKRYIRKDGSIIWVHIGAAAILTSEGKPESAVAVVLETTERNRTGNLLDAQKRSLEMVVSGAPLTEVLTYLTRVVEEQAEGEAIASVLMLDEQGYLHTGASPSLPEDYINAIDGLRADPTVGTCSAAAALGATVITPNIAADPKWQNLKHLPLKLGLRAAWSLPIRARDGRVLGTFGTYFRECREPRILERQTVEVLAQTAALAIERTLTEQRLMQSEEQLRALFEASRDGILVEQDEHIVYTNNSYARLLGYERSEDLIGLDVSAVMSPEDGERMMEYGRQRLRGESPPARYEFNATRKDGMLIELEASVSTHTVAGKTFITTSVRDIAERKQAEEALRQSESRYRLLMEEASDGIHIYDEQGNIIDTNLKLCDMLGYTREEMLRLNVSDLIPPEDLSAAPIRYAQLEAGETLLTERKLRRKDGSLLAVEISGKMVQKGLLQSIIRDITKRKRAEEASRRSYDELERRVEERTAEIAGANAMLKAQMAERLRGEEARRELLRRLVLVQEEERQRISRELHDQMGQQLTAMMMSLKALESDSYGRQASTSTLKQLQELATALARDVHSLAWGLRPPALDDLGIDTALYNYVEEWAKQSRVLVDFHSSGFDDGRLPVAAQTTIYRIAQEALTNVIKHSEADQVSLFLERRDGEIITVIEDNGRGFDVEESIRSSFKDGKLGVLGMRERASLLGGTLTIESAPGVGTSVFVRIPVEGPQPGRVTDE